MYKTAAGERLEILKEGIVERGYENVSCEAVGWGHRLESHATHSAHTAHASHTASAHARRWALLFGRFYDRNLGRTQERCDTAGVNERSSDDLERVKNTGRNHVDVLALGAVEALGEIAAILVHELANDNGALSTSVLDDRAGRAGDGVLDNADTKLLVKVGGLDLVQSVDGSLEETSSTTGEDTLLDSSAGGVESIDDPVFLLADLNLGRTADLDDGDTTRELSETLLELLLLVLGRSGVSHDSTDLLAALGDSVLAALAVKDDSVLLGDGDGASGAEHLRGALLELDVKVITENGTVGEDRKIAKNRLAVVTEAGGLDSCDLELAAKLVEDADSESLAVDVLGNDDQRTAELLGSLKRGDDVLDSGDLLLRQQDQRLLKLDLLGLGISDEVGRDETAVELHALGNLELIINGLSLLNSDDTLLADLLHGVGKELADVCITVGRDGGDLRDLLAGGDVFLVRTEVFNNGLYGSLGSSPQIHRVASGGHVLDGLGEDGAGKDGGSGGTVTSNLVGLGSDVLEEASTKVLELILQGDGLCDGYTIYQHVSIFINVYSLDGDTYPW